MVSGVLCGLGEGVVDAMIRVDWIDIRDGRDYNVKVEGEIEEGCVRCRCSSRFGRILK